MEVVEMSARQREQKRRWRAHRSLTHWELWRMEDLGSLEYARLSEQLPNLLQEISLYHDINWLPLQ